MENNSFEDIKELFKETQKRFKETDARLDKLIADTDARLDKRIAETDARLDKRFAETEKMVKELSRNIGGVSNSNGAFAEDFFYSSLSEKKQMGNIKFDAVEKNVRFSKKGVHGEFDAVMINGDSVALIEIKYKANAEHLQQLITQKPESFRKLFPEYKDYKFYLGLAGMSFDNEQVKTMAAEAGVAILEAHGDHAEIIAPNLKAY